MLDIFQKTGEDSLRLSIIILTCNQYNLTHRCLGSISDFKDNPSYEIILIDNGSTDQTPNKIQQEFPFVNYIYLPENKGVAAARNIGVANARGRRIMFLDNDTVASKETICRLEQFMNNHPDCGLVAPRLVDLHGKTQASFKDFPGIGLKLRNWLSERKDTVDGEISDVTEPFYVIGAAQMFEKEIFLRAGGLDENIFFGPEDADFCMSVRKLGLKVYYNPELTITHDWQRSTSSRKISKRAFLHFKALIHFYFKHRRFF